MGALRMGALDGRVPPLRPLAAVRQLRDVRVFGDTGEDVDAILAGMPWLNYG